jgi:hypothetical protein
VFKHFAQFSTSSETWVTRATRATETPKPRKPAASGLACPVAQNKNAWVTVGNQERAVAEVAQGHEEWATGGDSQKPAENCDFSEPVAQVTQVTQENDKPEIEMWDGADWRAYFNERAGIAEHDGGLSRADAEARAYECCVAEWLIRNPTSSEPGCCAWCGRENGTHCQVLPFSTGETGHTWLHSGCWPAWYADRRLQAVEGLAGAGIIPVGPGSSTASRASAGP